jgi:hypothetical protein
MNPGKMTVTGIDLLRHSFTKRISHLLLRPIRGESGQAMAEFVVFAPVLVLILIAIMFFGQGYYLKQKCYTAARYCAWYCGRHADGDQTGCQTTIKDIAFKGEDTDALTFDGPQGFGDIPDSFGLDYITSILSGLSQADKYTVSYKVKVPGVLSFMGEDRNPRSLHTVVSDCWTWMDPDSVFTGSTSGVNDLNEAPVTVP